MKKNLNRTLVSIAVGAACASPLHSALAAGFALIEQNGSGLGRAYAGSAAIADDASTIYYNPAGLTNLSGPQLVVAGSAINLSAKFSDNGLSSIPAALPARPKGGDGGDAGGVGFVPNLYLSTPIGTNLAVGLGVNAPFGLKTEYDDDWLGRFQGIKSDIKTINVNPTIAWRINDAFSVGGGVNWQHISAELTNAVVLGLNTEGRTTLDADGDAWGWNLGAMFRPSDDMRIGLSYRSAVRQKLEGDIAVNFLSGAPVPGQAGPARAEVKLPDSATLSVFQSFGPKWDLMGDIQWTHWSTIKEIDVVNANTGALRDRLTLEFDDAWRIALGLQYHHSSQWTFKGGLAWDQTPVQDAFRTVRLPDNDRYWVAVGARYSFNQRFAVDFGYAHLFIPNSSIDFVRSQLGAAGTSSRVAGDYKGSVDILSAQLTVSF